MKQAIYTLLLCILYLNISAQNFHHNHQPHLMYLDSAKEAYSYYLQPNDIERLDVIKGYDSTTGRDGKLIFSLKKESKLKFIPLDSIAASKQIAPGTPVLYIIDNEPVKSPAIVRIDNAYVYHAWVTKTAEIDNLKNTIPNLSILYIQTGKKQPNAPRNIMIRGNAEVVSR